MPVSIKTDPLSKLRPPQIHCLTVIRPTSISDPEFDWPWFTRATLRLACGLSPANTMNRILHGIKVGRSKHLGLIELGLVEEIPLDVEGIIEYNYRITARGIECLSHLNGADHK